MFRNHVSRWVTLTVVLVMVAALLPALPHAEARGGTIAYGDVVSGTITAKNYFEMWQFSGARGDLVQIYMEGDGNLDSYLGLLDAATETVLAEDDDSGGDGHAYIEMTLPATADYIIIATRYDFELGSTQGTYMLMLSRGGSTANTNVTNTVASDEPVEIDEGVYFMGDLALSEPVYGTIEEYSYAQVYGIELAGGTEVVVGMFADGSELDSYIFFTDENFDLLAEDDDSGSAVGGGVLDSYLSLTVPQSGYYYVVATRAGMDTGYSTGAYVLAVGIPEDAGTMDVVDDSMPAGMEYMGVLSAGDTISGTISSASYLQLYDYDGQAGEEITITMTGDSNLDAYLGLLDPAGEVIAEDDDSLGGLNAVITFTLPESGLYVIAATRAGIDEGTSTGAYTLTVKAGALETAPTTTGFSGFGGLPGRAMTSESGTFYLRGNGPSDNPVKSPPIEAFLGTETALPGTPSLLSGLLYGSDPLAPFGALNLP